MTSDPFSTDTADREDERRPSRTASAPEPPFAVNALPALPPAGSLAVAVTGKPDDLDRRTSRPAHARDDEDTVAGAPEEPGRRAPDTGDEPAGGRDADTTRVDADAAGAADDEPVHTLLRTAATERPLEEVAALVTRLQESGEVSRPADVALRAAAVARPLDEVRQLMALLKESGHDLDQAGTTLRAAAVGRPVDDVVELVSILGTDSSDWRADTDRPRESHAPQPAAGDAAAAAPDTGRKRQRRSGKQGGWHASALNSALAAGPAGHSVSPALRSVLRWPAALALFACGVIHVPTDLAGLRSGGYAETLSVAVTLLCLVGGVWLAVRDTLVMWAAAAGLAVGIIALHALAGAGTADLLNSSLGDSFTWAKALAVLSSAAAALLAGTVLVRRTGRAGAAKGA
ncbi:hypothetical protein ACWGRF_19495 [Streptomyces zhihengii]